MKRWKTSEVVSILEDLGTVKVTRPGGDYDTQNIKIKSDQDYCIHIAGFNPANARDYENAEAASDMDVQAVMVSDGLNHTGGCNGNTEQEFIFFGKVSARLRSHGFRLIDHYDQIF